MPKLKACNVVSSMISKNAKLLITRYGALADSMAVLFAGHLEVIIHDLNSQTVVYIANNISNRQLGDPAALDDVTFEYGEASFGPYEKCNWDGNNIRSVSTVLRDDAGHAIGVLCINLNTAPLEGMRDVLNLFLSRADITPQPDKLFHDDWQERINQFIQSWLAKGMVSLTTIKRKDRQELVKALYLNGAFKGKNTPDYVAKILGVGRATVFKYIKLAKEAE